MVAIVSGSPDFLAVRDLALFSAVRKSDFRKFAGAGPSGTGGSGTDPSPTTYPGLSMESGTACHCHSPFGVTGAPVPPWIGGMACCAGVVP